MNSATVTPCPAELRSIFDTLLARTSTPNEAYVQLLGSDWIQAIQAAPTAGVDAAAHALSVERRQAVYRLAVDLEARYETPVTCTHDDVHDYWELSWTRNEAGLPTEITVARAIATRAELAPHRHAITVHGAKEGPE